MLGGLRLRQWTVAPPPASETGAIGVGGLRLRTFTRGTPPASNTGAIGLGGLRLRTWTRGTPVVPPTPPPFIYDGNPDELAAPAKKVAWLTARHLDEENDLLILLPAILRTLR